MKKIFTQLFVFTLLLNYSYAQKGKPTDASSDSIQLLRELSENACKCIDSIKLRYKDAKEVSGDISECIDKQVGAYQLGLQLIDVVKQLDGANKNITVNVNENKKSSGYRSAYYQIEEWLKDSCKALNHAINSNNEEKQFSFSQNPKAIAQYNKGIELSNKENYADAIGYFKKAVSIDPTFAFAWDNLGISYRKTNQFDKALEAYNKSLEIDPEGKMPLQNIPVVYQYLKEYDKALEAYDNLLKVFPDDPETFYGKAVIYTYLKVDHEKALDLMCKAYNLYANNNSPYRVDAQKNIQYLYGEMKKAGKEEVFNKILKDNNIKTK